MFMGEYNHTIDAKGRLIIPSKFRELLGEEFVLTRGLDGCLYIYPMDEWESFEMKLRSLPLTNKKCQNFFTILCSWSKLHVNWTGRDESLYRRHCANLPVWRKMWF